MLEAWRFRQDGGKAVGWTSPGRSPDNRKPMGSEETSDCLSLAGLRALAIPEDDQGQWDHGELPHAVLNLENQRALSECNVFLGLTMVERRSLDETKESRAIALREVLLELLAKELDHPYCSALRALAGLEPGTAGRNR